MESNDEDDTTLSSHSPSCSPLKETSNVLLRPLLKTRSVDAKPHSRAAQLQASIAKARAEIDETQARLDETCCKLRESYEVDAADGAISLFPGGQIAKDNVAQGMLIKQARVAVNAHVKRLMRYNETRDVAMSLLEIIAGIEGKRLTEVMEERDVDDC